MILFIFQQHETIHATIKARDIDIVAPKIEIGRVYEIKKFFVDQSRPNIRSSLIPLCYN